MVSSVQGKARARAVEAPVEVPRIPKVVSNLVAQGNPKLQKGQGLITKGAPTPRWHKVCGPGAT